MTIMTWSNGKGHKGRCDGGCHGAKSSKCTCICGGRFHGANHRPGGLKKALEDAGEEVLAWTRWLGAKGVEVRVVPVQFEMWGEHNA